MSIRRPADVFYFLSRTAVRVRNECGLTWRGRVFDERDTRLDGQLKFQLRSNINEWFWLTFGGCGTAVITASFPQTSVGLCYTEARSSVSRATEGDLMSSEIVKK
jgi:hypothetical protein